MTDHRYTPGFDGQRDVFPETAELLSPVRNGKQLDAATFPPLAWAVPGLVPEGFTLMVGAPKLGKSWMALDMGLGVAAGGKVASALDADPGRVLYLAFEDSERRLQSRARHLLGPDPIPEQFDYVTHLDQPSAVLDLLKAWTAVHPDARLVIIDTLGKIMPPAPQGTTQYLHEYAVGSALAKLAASRGVAIVVVHHQRKMGSRDFLDTVSGTNGLSGSADTIAVLERTRGDTEAALKVTGRDVADQELGLRMVGGAWVLTGDPPRDPDLGDRSSRVLAHVDASHEPVSAEGVADGVGITRNAAKDCLARLARAGRILRSDRGLYTPVASVASVAGQTSVLRSDDAPEATLATPPPEEEPW